MNALPKNWAALPIQHRSDAIRQVLLERNELQAKDNTEKERLKLENEARKKDLQNQITQVNEQNQAEQMQNTAHEQTKQEYV